jgi:hypothetical protein
MIGLRPDTGTKEGGSGAARPPRWNWAAAGLVLCVAAVLIGAALALHFWKGVALADLTRDPVTTFQAAPYVGLLSQVGILLWAAAATVCLFGARMLAGRAGVADVKRFLFVSGLLTLVLGLDDAFLFHEEFVPRVGVPQGLVFVVYGALLVLYAWRFAPVILKTEFALLVAALAAFGVSLAVDVAHPEVLGRYLLFVEDGAKLVGTLFWLAYFARTGASAIKSGAGPEGAASGASAARLGGKSPV